jgi:hypothetical protein
MSAPANSKPVVRLKLIGGGEFAPDNFVPATRADCPVERPCPHVRCIHHLYVVDGDHRPGRRPKGGELAAELQPRWLEWPVPESCVLDIAQSKADVNKLCLMMGIRKSSFFEILRSALRKVKARPSDDLEND